MAIINRLDHASSKEKIGLWSKKTILPELLGFNPSKLNSKTFWYVTDDVISEKELREFRKENDCSDDIFAGIDDGIFMQMEEEIFEKTREHLCLDPSAIVLDKGNNREDNFNRLKDKAFWIGSLVPSHFNDLLKVPLSSYPGKYRKLEYITFKRRVMGQDCFLVLTFNKSLYKKQKLSLQTGIEKCKIQLNKKLDDYKRKPVNKLPMGIYSLKKEHRYGKYINVDIENSELIFTLNISEIKNALKRLGKNLLFTNKLTAVPEWLIEHYRDKNILEQDYHILKSPDIIRNRPIRHWTDTKIRAFCFSCVCALLIARIMELTVEKNYRRMSIGLIKEELQDLKLITMIYEKNDLEVKVTDRSTVQQKLFDIFNLKEVEKILTIHL